MMPAATPLTWWAQYSVDIAGSSTSPPVWPDICASRLELMKLMKTHENLDAPQGVRGRNSDNTIIREVLDWEPSVSLRDGLGRTYEWIEKQVDKDSRGEAVVD
jgi:nucleoside-diphosphate-sugar epimerase